uniref:Uncharacterized protein n=1 Tax=Panagrolaimus davidi TaxID=227884 RepID=A0A914P5P1_9BILA
MSTTRNLIVRVQFLSEPPEAVKKEDITLAEVCCVLINTSTNESSNFKIPCNANIGDEVAEFLKMFPNLIPPSDIKAIIFITAGNEFNSFITGYIFRLKLRKYCKEHGIFYSVSTFDALYMSDALCKTGTTVKEVEEVMFIRSKKDKTVDAVIIKRDINCFRHVQTLDPVEYECTSEWKTKFVGAFKLKKVILFQASKFVMFYVSGMKQLFKNESPVEYFNNTSDELLDQLAVSKVMHDMGEKINPNYVQIGLNNYFVIYNKEMWINIPLGSDLPVEEIVVIPVIDTAIVGISTDSPHYYSSIQKERLATFHSKRAKVTLKVDIHSCFEFSVEPFDGVDLNEELPYRDNPQPSFIKTSSLPRIVFDEESFYVCLLESDVFKTPIFISFTEAKPFIGKIAMEMVNDQAEFVIHDLIKLCSASSIDEIDSKWKNRLILENDNLMVTVQSTEGKVKASLQFFLAMILKDAIKIARKGTGEKSENFEIKFVDFKPNETLKKTFIEAAKLLKVGIVFG